MYVYIPGSRGGAFVLRRCLVVEPKRDAVAARGAVGSLQKNKVMGCQG